MSWQEVKDHSRMTFLEHATSIELVISAIGLMLIAIGFIFHFFKNDKLPKETKRIMSLQVVIGFILIMLIIITITYPWDIRTMRQTEHYQNWTKQYVAPYVNGLADTEREVTQLLTFTPDKKSEKDYAFNTIAFYENKINGIKDEDLLLVEFMYKSKNDVVKMYKGSAYIQYEKDRTVPIVKFKKIEHGLGNAIIEGFYAPILYLPKDFNIQENWNKEGVQ